MQTIKINLIPNGKNPTCSTSQYDTGRVIRCELVDGACPYTIKTGDVITLNLRKPDDTIVTSELVSTVGNTYVDIVTTEQMTACEGFNKCELSIVNGNTKIGSGNFTMSVEKDVLSDGIESESEIHDLQSKVTQAVDELGIGGWRLLYTSPLIDTNNPQEDWLQYHSGSYTHYYGIPLNDFNYDFSRAKEVYYGMISNQLSTFNTRAEDYFNFKVKDKYIATLFGDQDAHATTANPTRLIINNYIKGFSSEITSRITNMTNEKILELRNGFVSGTKSITVSSNPTYFGRSISGSAGFWAPFVTSVVEQTTLDTDYGINFTSSHGFYGFAFIFVKE